MFVLSKIFWWVFNPGLVFFAVLSLGAVLLFTRWRRTGRALVAAAVGIAAILSVLPVGSSLIETLENRFPANPPLPREVDGIIVLGGTVNQHITHARGQPTLTSGGERLTEFVALARRHPEARLVFTGGSGAVFDSTLREASVARLFFERMGLEPERVVFEDRARNTHENALFARRLMAPGAEETWILVTSALHMPRAVGVFRRIGWEVIPWPVDYQTDGRSGFELSFAFPGGLENLNTAGREWIGLTAYRVLGRTSTLFPGPAPATSDN